MLRHGHLPLQIMNPVGPGEALLPGRLSHLSLAARSVFVTAVNSVARVQRTFVVVQSLHVADHSLLVDLSEGLGHQSHDCSDSDLLTLPKDYTSHRERVLRLGCEGTGSNPFAIGSLQLSLRFGIGLSVCSFHFCLSTTI